MAPSTLGARRSKITENWIRAKERVSSSNRTTSNNGTRALNRCNENKKEFDPPQIAAFDCSGLICACINANSDPEFDTTADGLLHKCARISEQQ